MNAWQAVVFDLDDTLYPEQRYVASGFRAVAQWAVEHLGTSADDSFQQLWSLFEQGRRGDTFDRWLDRLAVDVDRPAAVAAMVDVYRQHTPRIEPYPGVRGMLARLKSRFRVGLLSDGYLAMQRRKLDALRLAPAFDAILLTDELGRDAWKPSPLPFHTVVERLGVAPSSAIYVADNPAKDFRGARAVGMATVRVRHADGLHARSEPRNGHDAADHEINHVTALEQWLEYPP